MVVLSTSSSFPLLFLFFLTFTSHLCNSLPPSTTFNSDSIILPLLHLTPYPTPSQSLSSDTHRLISLFSSLNHRRNNKHKNKIPQLPVTSGASTGSGQYFVDLRLGTPPQNFLLVVDTGSDLVWVTCSACRNCSARSPTTALFARHSSTFSPYHCFDRACQLVPHPNHTHCNHTRIHSACRYEYSYADGSLTRGFFSRETTTFKTTSGSLKHHNLAFGCAFELSGPSVTGPSFNGATGVIGLGRGPISFSSQLGHRFGNKFSYCLMDYTISPPPRSYLLIGGTETGAVKPTLKYTPLQNNSLSPTFYYIGIQSVYVERVKLRISPSVWAIDELGNGGTVVDSGTTLTFLAEPAYRTILTAFKRRVKLPSPAEPTLGFDLCVNVSGVKRLNLPRLSFKLVGGVLLAPPTGNYFIDTADNVKCLALQRVTAPSGFSVIGNLFQQGYLFEFDSDRSRLGFTRHGCAVP
ncbi:hypothetical protein LguiA_000525 [Lonicera macranthoides]